MAVPASLARPPLAHLLHVFTVREPRYQVAPASGTVPERGPQSPRATLTLVISQDLDPLDDLANATWEDAEWQ